MPKPVTPETLTAALDRVRAGTSTLYVQTALRCWVVDTKILAKYEALGRRILWPSKDGKGIRLASGKKSLYLLPGLLVEEAK